MRQQRKRDVERRWKERKREGEDGSGGGYTLTLHSRLHFMCTTYETLTPLRINYAGKLQSPERVIEPFTFESKKQS